MFTISLFIFAFAAALSIISLLGWTEQWEEQGYENASSKVQTFTWILIVIGWVILALAHLIY